MAPLNLCKVCFEEPPCGELDWCLRRLHLCFHLFTFFCLSLNCLCNLVFFPLCSSKERKCFCFLRFCLSLSSSCFACGRVAGCVVSVLILHWVRTCLVPNKQCGRLLWCDQQFEVSNVEVDLVLTVANFLWITGPPHVCWWRLCCFELSVWPTCWLSGRVYVSVIEWECEESTNCPYWNKWKHTVHRSTDNIHCCFGWRCGSTFYISWTFSVNQGERIQTASLIISKTWTLFPDLWAEHSLFCETLQKRKKIVNWMSDSDSPNKSLYLLLQWKYLKHKLSQDVDVCCDNNWEQLNRFAV